MVLFFRSTRMFMALWLVLASLSSAEEKQEKKDGAEEGQLVPGKKIEALLRAEKITADKISEPLETKEIAPEMVHRQLVRPDLPFYAQYGRRGGFPSGPASAGFRLGDLTFRPRIPPVSALYSENVRDEREDVLVSLRPGFNLNYEPTRNFSLSTDYQFGYNDYCKDVALDFFDHTLSAAVHIKDAGVRGLNFNLFEGYGQTGNTGDVTKEGQFELSPDGFHSFRLPQVYQAFTRLQNNVSGVGASYSAGKIDASASYQYGIVDYFSRADRGQDSVSHSVQGGLSFRHFRGFTPSFGYSYSRNWASAGPGPGSESHGFSAGVGIPINRALSANFRVSPSGGHDLASGAWTGDVIFDGSLAWTLRPGISLGFGGSAGMSESGMGATSRLFGTDMNLNVNITRGLSASVYTSHNNQETSAGSRTQTNLYGVGLNFQIHKHLSGNLNLNRSDNWASPVAANGHSALNTGSIGLAFQF